MIEMMDFTDSTPEELAAELAAATDAAEQAAETANREREAALAHAEQAADAKRRGAQVEAADHASAADNAASRARRAVTAVLDAQERARQVQLALDPEPGDDPEHVDQHDDDPEPGDQADDDPEPGDQADDDPEPGDQADDDQEPGPRARAWVAWDEAERAAHVACLGIDWLRYHLDGHCQGWRERIGDGATSTAA